jgi:hypothetical protein
MDKDSPYFREHSVAATRPSVVAIFDFLGFSQDIKEAYATGRAPELLARLREALSAGYESLRDTLSSTVFDKPRGWDVKAFTDNVVIGYPISDDGEFELGSIFESVALFQLDMIRQGFFVRGGIAVGEMYMDEDIVFGDALIKAYEGENSLARDPRIVVTESARSLMEGHLRYYAAVERAPQSQLVLCDEDGQFFVNYLAAIFVDEAAFLIDWLQAHQEIVEKKLQEHRNKPSVWSKYAWVARYHNYFCQEFGFHGSKIRP